MATAVPTLMLGARRSQLMRRRDLVQASAGLSPQGAIAISAVRTKGIVVRTTPPCAGHEQHTPLTLNLFFSASSHVEPPGVWE